MPSINSSTLGTRQIQQALRRGVKDVLVANDIQPSTRRGNKELDLAVQRLAQQTYSTLEEAAQTGEALGQKIVKLSQAKGKTDFDGGIVRQMLLTGEIPTVVKVMAKPAKTTPVVVNIAPKATPPALTKPAAAEVEAAVDAEANDPVELKAVEDEITTEIPSEALAALEPEELNTSEAKAVDDEDLDVASEVETMTDEADVIEADVVTDESPDITDAADVVADEVMAAEALETVDSEMADAPDLEAMATLEPAAIAAPAPEPGVATDGETVAAVEAIAPAAAKPAAPDKLAAIDATPSAAEALAAATTNEIESAEPEPEAVGTAT